MSNLAQRFRLFTHYFLWCSSGWDTVALGPSIEVCLGSNLTTYGRYHAPLSVILFFFELFFCSFPFFNIRLAARLSAYIYITFLDFENIGHCSSLEHITVYIKIILLCQFVPKQMPYGF